ncbi:MAG: VCBS repeat-containing protein [Burkholderiaceae bacterium]|nr:VCBS repeat-containing protein [Rhodoferax sp.]MCP5286755.1 VCBS repeat-containing protein [Burkholderiaceae bacterium]
MPLPCMPAGLRAALFLLPLLVACGGGGGGDATAPGNPIPPPAAGDPMPLAVGDRWLYGDEEGRLQLTEVTETRDVQGQVVRVVLETDLESGGTSETLVLKDDAAIAELPDPDDPVAVAFGALTTLKLPVREGETHVLVDRTVAAGYDLDEDGQPDAMRLRVDQTGLAPATVDVPAGVFAGCTQVQLVLRLSASLSSLGDVEVVTTVHQWLAPGVGLVRETAETVIDGARATTQRNLLRYAVGGTRSESRPPAVIGSTPAAGAVAGLTSQVQVRFDEPVALATLNDGGLVLRRPDGTAIDGTWNRSGSATAFNLYFNTLGSGRYTLSLTSRATDVLGNAAVPATWHFDVDISGPHVIGSTPASGANDVPRLPTLTLTFDEDLNPGTVTEANITLADEFDNTVPADVTAVDARTVQIRPRQELALGRTYTVSIGNGLADARGNLSATSTPLVFRTVQGLLSYPQALPGPVSRQVAAADIDGDGRLDLMGWIDETPMALDVRLQQADGSFAASRRYAMPPRDEGCGGLNDLNVVDMNADGRPDIVAASGCGVELILQSADGQFSERRLLEDTQVSEARVADLDGDGRLDIVGSSWSHDTVTVWRQGPGFSFGVGLPVPLFSNGYGDLAIGDLDGDGRAELVSSSGQGDLDFALGISYQQADGSFAAPQYQRLSGSFGQTPLAIADLDGDGRQDLLVHDPGQQAVSWYRQGADGRLEAPRAIASTLGSSQLLVTDLDGNGHADVVGYLSTSPGVILVHRQTVDGSFLPMESFRGPEGFGPTRALRVADLDGDGLPELLLPGPQIVFNQGLPATSMPSMRPQSALRRTATSALQALHTRQVPTAKPPLQR